MKSLRFGIWSTALTLFTLSWSSSVQAFDLEDYATTYRATRDAYNQAYSRVTISRQELAAVIALTNQITPNNADRYSIASGTSACSGVKESKDARSKDKVISEMTQLLNDSRIKHVQTVDGPQDGLTNILADMNSYYDQFSVSIFDEITTLQQDPPFAKDAMWIYKTQFDREDYATTYRAKSDQYLKDYNELVLATAPYLAAKAALVVSVRDYFNFNGCADAGLDDSYEELLAQLGQ